MDRDKILAILHLKSSKLFQRPGSKKKLHTSVECLSNHGFASTEHRIHLKRPQFQSLELFSLDFEARGLPAIVHGRDVAYSSWIRCRPTLVRGLSAVFEMLCHQ